MTSETTKGTGKPPPRWILKAATRTHVFLHRLTGGRAFNKLGSDEVCFVTMTGAKSGRRLTIPLMGGEDNLTEEVMEAMSPRWISIITTWLASPEGANVTGRVFDIRGPQLGIAEGWHLGPVETQPDDPTELGPVMEKLMGAARLNANMNGTDHEGAGFPGQSI